MIAKYVVLIVGCFFILRCLFALVWNHEMANIARKENNFGYWYRNWEPVTAIYNPKHWLKWTTGQWVKYQKSKFGDN